jgi:hypothetical protein
LVAILTMKKFTISMLWTPIPTQKANRPEFSLLYILRLPVFMSKSHIFRGGNILISKIRARASWLMRSCTGYSFPAK